MLETTAGAARSARSHGRRGAMVAQIYRVTHADRGEGLCRKGLLLILSDLAYPRTGQEEPTLGTGCCLPSCSSVPCTGVVVDFHFAAILEQHRREETHRCWSRGRRMSSCRFRMSVSAPRRSGVRLRHPGRPPNALSLRRRPCADRPGAFAVPAEAKSCRRLRGIHDGLIAVSRSTPASSPAS
jgi:hypothetical protein